MNKKLKLWFLRAFPFLLILLKAVTFGSAGGSDADIPPAWSG